jgi:preprotein translocase subunit YajC
MALLLFMSQPPQGGQGDATGQLLQTLFMFGAIILIFYFMMIRPQQKRAKEHKALLNSLSKGDKVVIGSGIHGVVYDLTESTVVVTIAPNTHVTFDRSSVSSVSKS